MSVTSEVLECPNFHTGSLVSTATSSRRGGCCCCCYSHGKWCSIDTHKHICCRQRNSVTSSAKSSPIFWSKRNVCAFLLCFTSVSFPFCKRNVHCSANKAAYSPTSRERAFNMQRLIVDKNREGKELSNVSSRLPSTVQSPYSCSSQLFSIDFKRSYWRRYWGGKCFSAAHARFARLQCVRVVVFHRNCSRWIS